jgi:hypothetical protein
MVTNLTTQEVKLLLKSLSFASANLEALEEVFDEKFSYTDIEALITKLEIGG